MRIGSDSEFFAVDEKGTFKSVIDKLGGSKDKPRPIGNEAGYFIQEDNVSAEFNIPPCSSQEQFVDAMSKGLDFAKAELSTRTGWMPSLTPFAIFDKVELSNPKASMFGCNPFISAWTFEEGVLSPETLSNPAARFAAGHVHISWDNPDTDPFKRIYLAKALDLWLALPFVLHYSEEELALERARRELYGKAGSIRPKSYGVEYIVMSNQWLKSKERMAAVWYGCQRAMGWANREGDTKIERNSNYIQSAINNCDVKTARDILEFYLGGDTRYLIKSMFIPTKPVPVKKAPNTTTGKNK